LWPVVVGADWARTAKAGEAAVQHLTGAAVEDETRVLVFRILVALVADR
jgi:hypothetical protein